MAGTPLASASLTARSSRAAPATARLTAPKPKTKAAPKKFSFSLPGKKAEPKGKAPAKGKAAGKKAKVGITPELRSKLRQEYTNFGGEANSKLPQNYFALVVAGVAVLSLIASEQGVLDPEAAREEFNPNRQITKVVAPDSAKTPLSIEAQEIDTSKRSTRAPPVRVEDMSP